MTVEERYTGFAKAIEKANYLITCRENGQPINPDELNKSLYSIATSFFNDSKVQEKLTEEQKQRFMEMLNDTKYIDKPLTPSVSNIVDINRVREEKSRKLA